jgi:putative transposase
MRAQRGDRPVKPLPLAARGIREDQVERPAFPDAQQGVARKQRGSANRKRAKAKVAGIHRKIRNRRADFHHKTARALIASCDAIAVEILNIAGLSKRARPVPDPGQPGAFLRNGAAAKSGLNKSILDAGWGQFTTILAGKAEEAGRRIVAVDPRNTSVTCHQCGAKCTRPRQDTVICPAHGEMDADINGARNIYARAGLRSGQAASAA